MYVMHSVSSHDFTNAYFCDFLCSLQAPFHILDLLSCYPLSSTKAVCITFSWKDNSLEPTVLSMKHFLSLICVCKLSYGSNETLYKT